MKDKKLKMADRLKRLIFEKFKKIDERPKMTYERLQVSGER